MNIEIPDSAIRALAAELNRSGEIRELMANALRAALAEMLEPVSDDGVNPPVYRIRGQ